MPIPWGNFNNQKPGEEETAVLTTAADVFLALNGMNLQADEKEFEELVLSVAKGKTEKATIAKFFRQDAG